MDGDPAVEPELDNFSLILPLPYRIGVIFVLGIWAWGVNLHYLSFLKIVCRKAHQLLLQTLTFMPGRPGTCQILYSLCYHPPSPSTNI